MMLVAILRPSGVDGNEAVRCPGGEVGTTIRVPRDELEADGFARAPPGEHRHTPLPSQSRHASVVRMLAALRHARPKSRERPSGGGRADRSAGGSVDHRG